MQRQLFTHMVGASPVVHLMEDGGDMTECGTYEVPWGTEPVRGRHVIYMEVSCPECREEIEFDVHPSLR